MPHKEFKRCDLFSQKIGNQKSSGPEDIKFSVGGGGADSGFEGENGAIYLLGLHVF